MSIEVKAWKCEKCGKAWMIEELANGCCKEKEPNKCRVCGCEVKAPSVICSECREKERYEKAEKIKYSDYNIGCLWDERTDKYYWDKEDLEEDYYNDADEEGKEPIYPDWCYGCTSFTFEINIDNVIERESEEMYEDFDENHIVDLAKLQNFIKEWNEKQSAITYYPDYKTVILLNE